MCSCIPSCSSQSAICIAAPRNTFCQLHHRQDGVCSSWPQRIVTSLRQVLTGCPPAEGLTLPCSGLRCASQQIQVIHVRFTPKCGHWTTFTRSPRWRVLTLPAARQNQGFWRFLNSGYVSVTGRCRVVISLSSCVYPGGRVTGGNQ